MNLRSQRDVREVELTTLQPGGRGNKHQAGDGDMYGIRVCWAWYGVPASKDETAPSMSQEKKN